MSALVSITKAPRDPVCTRVSIGGNNDIGYYLTYRGDRDAAIEATEIALAALKAARDAGPEGEISRAHKELGAS